MSDDDQSRSNVEHIRDQAAECTALVNAVIEKKLSVEEFGKRLRDTGISTIEAQDYIEMLQQQLRQQRASTLQSSSGEGRHSTPSRDDRTLSPTSRTPTGHEAGGEMPQETIIREQWQRLRKKQRQEGWLMRLLGGLFERSCGSLMTRSEDLTHPPGIILWRTCFERSPLDHPDRIQRSRLLSSLLLPILPNTWMSIASDGEVQFRLLVRTRT